MSNKTQYYVIYAVFVVLILAAYIYLVILAGFLPATISFILLIGIAWGGTRKPVMKKSTFKADLINTLAGKNPYREN